MAQRSMSPRHERARHQRRSQRSSHSYPPRPAALPADRTSKTRLRSRELRYQFRDDHVEPRLPHSSGNPDKVRRFADEIQLLVRLRRPLVDDRPGKPGKILEIAGVSEGKTIKDVAAPARTTDSSSSSSSSCSSRAGVAVAAAVPKQYNCIQVSGEAAKSNKLQRWTTGYRAIRNTCADRYLTAHATRRSTFRFLDRRSRIPIATRGRPPPLIYLKTSSDFTHETTHRKS